MSRHRDGPAEPEPGEAANIYCEACPSRQVLALVADKWTLLLMPALSRAPLRNSELMRLVEGISQKMLTQTLRELERNGLVVRHDFGEVPPRVEYTLTPLGRSLAHAIRKLDDWAEGNFTEVVAARERFDAARG